MDANSAGENIYADGSYLAKTGGTWHLEDSPFKARWIVSMLARHVEIKPNTICEIGCGAGGILAELQKTLSDHITFTGYDISPQAHALSARFSNPRCQFILGDAFAEESQYDLVLVMDVIEHVEDYFSFLRHARQKGGLKLYHIPLDAYVSGILRGNNSWDSAGHLHLFTIETALKALEHTGHRVVDWIFTDGAIVAPQQTTRGRIANLLRIPLSKFSTKLTSRLLGGYSMLVLAE
jgi:cyclopropane fatty-acyl-phospholipid synthase-like methyltransferase